jgi:hypothetical protein
MVEVSRPSFGKMAVRSEKTCTWCWELAQGSGHWEHRNKEGERFPRTLRQSDRGVRPRGEKWAKGRGSRVLDDGRMGRRWATSNRRRAPHAATVYCCRIAFVLCSVCSPRLLHAPRRVSCRDVVGILLSLERWRGNDQRGNVTDKVVLVSPCHWVLC